MVEKKSAEDRLADLLEKFMEKATSSGLSADQLDAVLSKVGVTNALAMQKAIKPENERVEEVSAFYTLADRAKYGLRSQKPKLIGVDGQPREVFLNFHRENEEQLTPAEIESYNSITRDCEARNGAWKAEIKDKGRRLHITVPVAFMDARMNLPPSLILLIHELKTGQGVPEIHEMLAEIARLKRKLGESDDETVAVGTTVASKTMAAPSVPVGSTVADLEAHLDSQPYPTP